VLGGFTYTFPDGVTKKYEVSKDRKGMTDHQAYMIDQLIHVGQLVLVLCL